MRGLCSLPLVTLTPLRPGDPTTLGWFQLLARVGEGGMGTVFLARDAAGRRAAVKAIRPDIAADQEFRARFSNEVRRARQVPAFCTAAVLDADPDGEMPWMAVEYVDGPSLEAVIRDHGPLPEHELQSVAVGVATALVSIHGAGVVHRDLKPANVLLAPSSPKVIDFGISRSTDSASVLTRPDHMVGTIAYMAPERFDTTGRLPITPAADIFAWGVLVAYAVTGRTPFGGESPLATAGSILTQPPDLTGLTGRLRDLVAATLVKDPAARPNAASVLDKLLRDGEPTSRQRAVAQPDLYAAALEASAAAARRDVRRRLRHRAAAAAAALTLIGGSVAVATHFAREAQAAGQESRRRAVAAVAQQLITRARGVLRSDPGLSLRLAMTAQVLAPSDPARGAVIAALATRYQGELDTTQPTWRAVYSPDGKTIATVGVNGSGDLWRVEPGGAKTHAASLPLGDEDTLVVAFSPDGRILATFGDKLRLWSVVSPGSPRLLSTSTSTEAPPALLLSFTRDGTGLMAGGSMWDVTDPSHPRRKWSLRSGNFPFRFGSFDVANGIVASHDSDADTALALWKVTGVRSPRLVGRLKLQGGIGLVAFRSDGRLMAAADPNGIRLFDMTQSTPRLLKRFGESGPPSTLGFDRTGTRLAVGNHNRHDVTVWDLRTPAKPTRIATFTGHSAEVTSVDFSPDSTELLTAGHGPAHTTMTWRVDGLFRPALRNTLLHDVQGLGSVDITPTGTVQVRTARSVRSWPLDVGSRPTATTVAGNLDYTERGTLRSGGNDLLDGLTLYDIADPGRPRVRQPADTKLSQSFLDINPESGLAATTEDLKLSVAIRRIPEDGSLMSSSAIATIEKATTARFVRHTSLLLTDQTENGNKNAVVVWDIQAPERPRRVDTVVAPDEPVGLAYSGDGRKVAFTTGEGAHFWRPGSGQEPVVIPAADGTSALSSDGSLAAVETGTGTGIWSTIDNSPPTHLWSFPETIRSTAFGTDRPVLATTSPSDARLWDVSNLAQTLRDPLSTACRLTSGLGRDPWKTYVPDLPFQPSCPA